MLLERLLKRVYIAGSYSSDNVLKVLENIRKGIRAGTEVLLAGFSPFIPFLDYNVFLQLREGEVISVDTIQAHSLSWLEVCQAVLVLPGSENSKGTQKEIQRAYELDIPTFYNLDDLKKVMK